MKYLPFEEFEIHTNLSSDEVFYRLRAATDKERNWWILANKPFWGNVERNNFRIRRYRGWWRNYAPVILGEIRSKDVGCYLQIRIRWLWLAYLVYSLILGFIWLSFLIGQANLIVQRIQTGIWQFESFGEWLLSLVLFLIFFGLIYLLSVGTLKYEAFFVRDYLLNLSETATENIITRDRILEMTESQIVKTIFIISIVISAGWMIYKLIL